MDWKRIVPLVSLFAALIAPAHAIELRGVVIERGLVTTPDGARETAQLRTADGSMVALDLGPPGGEATIAPGEAVIVAAHPGELQGKPVLVVDVIVERTPINPPHRRTKP